MERQQQGLMPYQQFCSTLAEMAGKRMRLHMAVTRSVSSSFSTLMLRSTQHANAASTARDVGMHSRLHGRCQQSEARGWRAAQASKPDNSKAQMWWAETSGSVRAAAPGSHL